MIVLKDVKITAATKVPRNPRGLQTCTAFRVRSTDIQAVVVVDVHVLVVILFAVVVAAAVAVVVVMLVMFVALAVDAVVDNCYCYWSAYHSFALVASSYSGPFAKCFGDVVVAVVVRGNPRPSRWTRGFAETNVGMLLCSARPRCVMRIAATCKGVNLLPA